VVTFNVKSPLLHDYPYIIVCERPYFLAHAESNTTIFHKSGKTGGGLVYRGILSERHMKEGSGNGASLSLSLSLSLSMGALVGKAGGVFQFLGTLKDRKRKVLETGIFIGAPLGYLEEGFFCQDF
jgi:hypothetical protein